MKKEKQVCVACGRPMNVYRIALNKSLAEDLVSIAAAVAAGESFNFKDLLERKIITASGYTNMSHLRYLNLVKKEPGKRRYVITELGWNFVTGGDIPAWVRVYDNRVIEVSQDLINLYKTVGYYCGPDVWSRAAERLTPKTESQPEFSLDK